jgi:hypothetical protein
MKAAALLAWYLDHLDEPPLRLHERGVWHDPTDGAGSALGSPALSHWFAVWLEAAATVTITEPFAEQCNHPGCTPADRERLHRELAKPEPDHAVVERLLCRACCTYGPDGKPEAETGIMRGTRTRYRWPMRAVWHRLRQAPVPPGYPDLAVTLYTLALYRDLDQAAVLLAARYPALARPRRAWAHLVMALRRARAEYRETPPPRPLRGKSEAQLNAEAKGLANVCSNVA